MDTRRRFTWLLVPLIVAGLLAVGEGARAATFTPTKLTDSADGSCDAADCSLREAVIAANANGVGADVINLSSGTYTLSLVGDENASAAGDLDINTDLTINGPATINQTLSGGFSQRVFEVAPLTGTSTVIFNSLTITGGRAVTGQGGGGILNHGALTLSSSTISGNFSFNDGGGIKHNGSTLTINSSTISGNTLGEGASGAGIASLGTTGSWSITASTVSGNSTGTTVGSRGGGVRNAGSLSIASSTISGNSANEGGGVSNSGTLNVIRSTISGNSSGNGGGGIYSTTNSILNIDSSTISGNNAAGAEAGGGIRVDGTTATIKSSTIANNGATNFGGGIHQAGGAVTIKASILGDNTAAASPDCAGVFTSGGFNVVENAPADCEGFTNGVNNDATGVDPQLGPLANNGGPTQTHAIPNTSPAFNRHLSSDLDCPETVPTDQRGITRPQGAHCDSGAFELLVPPPRQLTVTGAGTGSGFVDSAPAGIDCGQNLSGHTDCAEAYVDGTSVTLTAHPEPGTTFAGFSGGCTSATTTCTTQMDADRAVTATFNGAPPRQLTVTGAGTGSGFVDSAPAGIDCGQNLAGHTDCAEAYVDGTSVTLTAHPEPGTTFAGFSGGCTSATTTCTTQIDADRAVTATFNGAPPRQLTVTGAGTGSGFVDSAPAGIDCGQNLAGHTDCAEAYVDGTSVTLTAHPEPGTTFAGFSGGCTSATTTCTTQMDADRAVTATFNATQSGGGGGGGGGGGTPPASPPSSPPDPAPPAPAPPTDTTPPDTTITSGPESKTKDRTPTFTFTSSESGSTFECSVDGGAFVSCSSPFTTAALKRGKTHTFAVRATDASGNVDATPATSTFKVTKKPK